MPQSMAMRLSQGGGELLGETQQLILRVCWGISVIIFFFLSPLMLFLSIFLPDLIEKLYLPVIEAGAALIFAPLVLIVLGNCYECCDWGACCSECCGECGSLFSSLGEFCWNLLCEGLEWLFRFCWNLPSTCWSLFVLGVKIVIYRTPPLSYFWRRWTIRTPRFGWEPSNLPQHPDVQPQSGDKSKSDYRTSSKLCKECVEIVDQSGLLVGSISAFTPRYESHKWSVSLLDLDLGSSQEFCHLCNIFWYSIPEEKRWMVANIEDPGTSDTSQDPIKQTIDLRVEIWEDDSGRWYDDHRCYMELYRGEERLCDKFEICEEPLKDQSATIELPLYTGSDACIKLAKYWIENCHTHHDSCSGEELSQPFLPTRLIYVGDSNSLELHLHERPPNDTEIRYLALSHCWGEEEIAEKITKLTRKNHDEWRKKIDYDALPANFKHAIDFTRKIGESYLWIDSLCIVQGCDGDWGSEAKTMSKVYAQAYCTISASASADANGGCFKNRKPFLKFPCNLLFSDQKTLTIRANESASNASCFDSEVDQSLLSKRGWTFQERLLSRRIVHFGATFLFFECSTNFASELLQMGEKYNSPDQEKKETSADLRRSWLFGFGASAGTSRAKKRTLTRSAAFISSQYDPVTGYRAAFNALRRGRSEITDHKKLLRLHICWFKLVAMYTSAKLTKSSDRLIAIYGIAKGIQGDEDTPEYLAGLWRHHLPFDLLWCLEAEPQNRPEEPRAPSWSWGVVDGGVCGQLLSSAATDDRYRCSVRRLAKVCGFKVEELSPGIFWGRLDLECPLLLPVIKMTSRKPRHGFDLQIQGCKPVPFEAEFIPDINPIPQSGLLCAEIVRVAFYEQGSKSWSLQSDGIVLRRMDDAEEPFSYERLGRFSAGWRLEDEEVSKYVAETSRLKRHENTADEFLEALRHSGKGSFDDVQLQKIRVI